MPITILELEGEVTKVLLSGRIDIVGAREIEMPMAVVAGSRRAVVVDLSAVEFMASLGLRGIVISAQSILRKKGNTNGSKVWLFRAPTSPGLSAPGGGEEICGGA